MTHHTNLKYLTQKAINTKLEQEKKILKKNYIAVKKH
jgi:hypothetical protein